ncbi:acyltransferase [Bacillus sp. Y1]|nr:acyltransferase [Bacillus sp. Y1]AYA78086.1 acyltransferase [Bacillus sp. Y1]
MLLLKAMTQWYRLIKDYYIFIYNKLLMKKNRVEINDKTISSINGIIFIQNNGIIQIASDVKINSRYRNNPIGGQQFTSLVVGNNAELVIKERVGISNSAIVANKKIIIEEDVFIGGDCKIYDTDFHSIDFKERISKKDRDIKMSDVTIKKGAFIGTGTIILKGVTIGEYSVVGAGSVVTKDIPPKEVWAGNPAKLVKKL